MDAGFEGNFFRRAVAAIVIEEIAFAFEAPGAALHKDAFEAAEFVATELGKLVHVQMGIARDEEVDETVAVVVAPGCARHEATAADSRLISYVVDFAVAKLVVDVGAA